MPLRTLLAVLLPLCALVALPTTTHACALITDGNQPDGWGAAYNVFSSAGELILRADCTTDNFTPEVGSARTDDTNFAVYSTGYYYDGSEWAEMSYSPVDAAQQYGTWILGDAEASESIDYVPGTNTFFAAYTCHWDGSGWNCGCQDESCSAPAWQLQAVRNPNMPPPSGGGGGGVINPADAACERKPTLTNPLIIDLQPSGNPETTNANGRDVLLRWPDVPVTDPTFRIQNANNVVSIGGDFRPRGEGRTQGAFEFTSIRDGAVVYLESMNVDLSGRTHQSQLFSRGAERDIPITGDAIGFGGVLSSSNPTYPSLVLNNVNVEGVSGQHGPNCSACGGAHADGIQLRGGIDDVVMQNVRFASTYQTVLLSPARGGVGDRLSPSRQQTSDGVVFLDNVTLDVIRPPNLSSSAVDAWRSRVINNVYMSNGVLPEGQREFSLVFGENGVFVNPPNDPGFDVDIRNYITRGARHPEAGGGSVRVPYARGNNLFQRGSSPRAPGPGSTGPGTRDICSG